MPRRCRPTGAAPRLGYHDHYVVDGGKARIILTALVTPAEVQENQPALDLLWRTRFRWKLRPRQVTGDTQVRHRREHRRRSRTSASAPTCRCRRRASRRGLFGEHGLHLRRRGRCLPLPRRARRCASSRSATRTQRRIYQAPAAACNACALRAHCTTSRAGRRVGRSFDEDVPGPGARLPRDRALRQGDAQAEGLGRAALRRGQGLARAAPLPAAGAGEGQRRGAADRRRPEPEAPAQQAGWGRRPWPSGAAGVGLPATPVAALACR